MVSAWLYDIEFGQLGIAWLNFVDHYLLILSLKSNWSSRELLLLSLLLLCVLIMGWQFVLLRQRQRQIQVESHRLLNSAQKDLQNPLEQQAQIMDTILSALPDNVYMFDQDGRFLYASRAGLQALGLQKSDIFGKTEQELGFPPELIEEHKQRRKQVFTTSETLRGETSVPTVDGVRHYEYILIPIHNATGSVDLVVAIGRDITERRQTEEELAQYRNHLEEVVAVRTAELVKINKQLNQEIVDRQTVEEALRVSQQQLSALAKRIEDIAANIPGAVYRVVFQADGTPTLPFISEGIQTLSGISPAEAMANPSLLCESLYPDDRAKFDELLQGFSEACQPFNQEFRIVTKSGSVQWIQNTARFHRTGTGELIVDGVAFDSSERKQAEQEIQRQNQYRQLLAEITLRIRESLQIEAILQTTVAELQQLLQVDRVLFYRLLPNYKGQVVAEAGVAGWPSLLGQELVDRCFASEYLGQYQQEIHAWSDVEQAGFQPCHLDMLRQFGIKANLIVPIFLKDKIWGLLFVQQCCAPRQWTRLEIELLRQLANQLSIALAQAQLLEQQTHYSQQLASSNAQLEQFAYVASHDLQEPLRTLASYAKLLSRRYAGQLDEKGNRFIQYILEEALRMQALINDLLLYSRVGRQAQSIVPCNCAVVLDIAIGQLQDAIANSDATITYGELPTIRADETQMVQLFQNLIGNAIKYRSQEPLVVQVGAVHQEEQWLFWVCDNGIGIDPKYAERIFVIFQRLHTQEEYPGTGIGLAIAAKIVERHGGRIWVESELGKGATFYFTIPERESSCFLT